MGLRGRGALVSVLACMALGLTGLAGCGDDGSAESAAATRSTASPVHALVPTFAVFRRARTLGDEIPMEVLPRQIAASLGLDMTTSRFARTYEKQLIYLVASTELVCTYSSYNPVSNCWPLATVKQGRAMAASICGLGTRAGETVIYGIVPDGAKSVTILRRGGDERFRVAGNMFVAPTSSAPPLPTHLAFRLGGRKVVRSTAIPPDVARRGCRNDPPPGAS